MIRFPNSRVTCLVLLAIGFCGVAPDRAAAGLRCVPPATDLGEIRSGAPQKTDFVLVNDGVETIEVVDVERGCGCLQTRLDRQTLRPGRKSILAVEVRTTGQPDGPRSWNVRVRYRDGAAVREEVLVIAATIRNDVVLQPPMLAFCVQDVLRQEVVVTDLRSPPLKVTRVHTTSPAVLAVVQSSANGVTRVQVEAASAGLKNEREEAFLNVYTDDPVYALLQVPITLTRARKPFIQMTPAQVNVRISAERPRDSALVRLRSTDGQKVVVDSAATDDPGVTCTWAAGPGNDATLKVQVDGRHLANGDAPRAVRIRLAEPSREVSIAIVIEK